MVWQNTFLKWNSKDQLTIALSAIGYIVLFKISLLFLYQPQGIAVVWFSNGALLAGLILCKPKNRLKLLTVVFLCNFFVNLWVDRSLPISLGLAFANCLEGAVAIKILSPQRFNPAFNRLSHLLWLLYAVCIGTAVGATLGSLVISPSWDVFKYMAIWNNWWTSGSLGVFLIVPLVLVWRNFNVTEMKSKWVRLEALVLFFIAILFIFKIFSQVHNVIFFRPFFIFPLFIWASLRFKTWGVMNLSVILVTLSIWFTNQYLGPFHEALYSLDINIMILEIFLLIIIISSLVIALVFMENNEIKSHLQHQTVIFEATIKSMGDGLIVNDINNHRLVFNQAAERILGRKDINLPIEQRARIYGLYHMDSLELYAENELPLQRSLKGENIDFEEILVRNSFLSADKIISVNGRPLKNEKGLIQGSVIVFRDITEQKRFQRDLQIVIDAMPALISYWDKNLLNRFANNKYSEWLGILPQVILGKPLKTVFEEKLYSLFQSKLLSIFQGQTQEFETKMLDKQGYERYLKFNFVPDIHQGEVQGVCLIARDISDIHHYESQLEAKNVELQNSLELYQAVINNSNDGFTLVNEHSRFIKVNSAYAKMLGYTIEEMEMMQIQDVEMDDDQSQILTMLQKIINKEVNQFERRHRHKNGSIVEVEVTVNFLSKQQLFCSLLRDVTLKKSLEKERLELIKNLGEEYLKTKVILNTAMNAIISIDEKGIVESYNLAAEKMFGYLEEEVHGKNIRCLMPEPYSKEHDQYLKNYLISGQKKIIGLGRRVFAKHKSGREFPIQLQVGESFIKNKRIFIGVIRDLSEEDHLEQQVRQKQKMEAIGTLAGGIAHDFNNILFAILGNLSIVKEDLPISDKIYPLIKSSIDASNRAKDLVRQILLFSRVQKKVLQPIDVKMIINETLKMMRSTLPSSISISTQFATYNTWIMADASNVHQVLVNLIVNAGQAMKDGGDLIVSMSNEFVENSNKPTLNLNQGEYLVVSVLDSGKGIDPNHLDRIFEPFFTTKPVGEGTGLGLAVVHGIIKELAGDIVVESKVGEGTLFKVYIPTIDPIKNKIIKEQIFVTKVPNKILIIDDNSLVLFTAISMLKSLQLDVISSDSPIEALAIFNQNPDQFSLVITDQIMPKMMGLDLIAEIHKIRPALPTILVTGDNKELYQERAKELRVKEIITKPFTLQELSRILSKIFPLN